MSVNAIGAFRGLAHNADAVHPIEVAALPLLRLAFDELVQALAAALLHALEAEPQIDGKFKAEGLVSLEDVDPAQHWTFVVRRSAADEPALVVDGQLERVRVPSVADFCLHAAYEKF